MRAGLTAR